MSEISELFDRDPLHLSDQDITIIVAYEREHQAKHELGVKLPSAKPKKPSKASDMLKELGLNEVGSTPQENDLLKMLGLK
jgi:hypothetical protein